MRIKKFFGKLFNKSPTATRFELVTERGNGFYSWNGQLYQSDIVRSCIRPMATAIGKLVGQHIRNDAQGFKVNPEVYIRFLLEEPNSYMTGQLLQEKLANQLVLNNNAFALIVRDDSGYATEIYPIPAVSVEALYDNAGLLYLRFHARNGKMFTYPYSDIIHIRRDFVDNDVFGESIAPALTSLMEIVTVTDQGIIKAVKNSSAIKWLLKFTSTLRPEDIKKATKEFVDNYLSIDSDVGGAAAADAKYDAKQVDPKDYVPNAVQMDRTTQRIYSLFGTNTEIVQSKFTEDQWNAYWEAVLEPVATQLANEFTRKIFSRRERSFGNQIVFNASNLQYASMATKLNLVQMVDRGSLTPNEWRAVMNLPPIEDGDKPIRRLDTAVVGTYSAFKKTRFKALKNEDEKEELKKVKQVIKTLSKEEKAELGPRYFYDDSQYRYIVEMDDKPVGFIENRVTGKKGHFNLAVDPDHRGQGIADNMVERAISDAPEKLPDIEKILWITSEGNEASKKLAEKHGFVLTSVEDGEVRYTYWLIERDEE